MAVIIDLDKGQANIVSGLITDDILQPCTELKIAFECQSALVFPPDPNYAIRYKNAEWVACNYGRFQKPDEHWRYELTCYPKYFVTVIDSKCTDTNELAQAMNLQIKGEALPIKYPMKNMYATDYINEIQRQSFNSARLNKNMNEAYFIYFNTDYMRSTTWGNLVSTTALDIEWNPIVQGGNIITDIDDRQHTMLSTAKKCEVFKRDDYIYKIMGRKLQIEGATATIFAMNYTIKVANTDAYDKDVTYLCVHTEQDVMNPSGYINVYAEMRFLD